IYDKIDELVEEELGGVPEAAHESFPASVVRSGRQSVTIVVGSLVVTVRGFLLGLVHFVASRVGTVVTALAGGWRLGFELTTNAFDRRGLLRIRDRHRFMAGRKLRVLGFAVPTYFLLAVPFVAVVVFPAAAAGGTILTRELCPGPPSTEPPPSQV